MTTMVPHMDQRRNAWDLLQVSTPAAGAGTRCSRRLLCGEPRKQQPPQQAQDAGPAVL
jgi:hypothetical protein